MRHTIHPLLAAVVLGIFAPAAIPAASDALPDTNQTAGELIREGRYEITYFGQTVGREQFSILRTESGYEITATLRMSAGDQPSCTSIYTLDENRRLVKATFTPLDDPALTATYTRDGSTLQAIAERNGETVGEQTITIDPDAVVTGPHYVTDFFVLAPLEYETGVKRSVPAYAFGFQDWRLHDVEMECKREKNRSVDGPDRDDIDTRVYRAWIDTDDGSFKTRSFLDDEGVSVRITIERLIGYVEIRLRNAD